MAVGQKPDRALTPQKALPHKPHGAAGWGELRSQLLRCPSLQVHWGLSPQTLHPSLGPSTPPTEPVSLPWTWHHCHGSSIPAWPTPEQLEFGLGVSRISLLWSLMLCVPSEMLKSSVEHRAVWVGDTCVLPPHRAP